MAWCEKCKVNYLSERIHLCPGGSQPSRSKSVGVNERRSIRIKSNASNASINASLCEEELLVREMWRMARESLAE